MKEIKKHVAKALAITITSSMLTAIPFEVKASVGKKISVENMTVLAKSNTSGHEVSLATDGNPNTYWESSNNYRWVELDLDGTYSLSSIKLINKTGGYYNYNVYTTSDGENYEKVAYKDNNNDATIEGDLYNLNNVKASKIRIDVTFSSANNDSNIAEVELYGEKVSNDVPKEKAISVDSFNNTKWSEEYSKFENDVNYANQKIIKEMTNMVGRVIGDEYKEKFQFELINKTFAETDVFEVEDGANGKVVIRGNDGVSLASGFNYYLKNYAKVMYNPMMGSNLNMPEVLPNVGEKIVIDTPYEQRYALNFCTYSYTMAFWDWNEYESFLDWSAMNGFNLVLDIVGQEEVLRRTLRQFGYTDEEIKEYISGPGYFAWFYMQNMTGFGGPLPNNWFEERTELGRKMHDRMQTLGITPVLQGYSGGVPLDFTEKNQDAQVIKQGEWCGFDRPDMLKTYVNEGETDYFTKVANAFYEAQKEIFGDVTNYYSVDPFHEGGNTGDLDNSKIYTTVQNKMIEYDNDAVWVIQHWQGNPNNAKLAGLKKDQALILDLNSDLNPDGDRFDSQDIPWIWNMLHNFGGRMGLDGQPEILANNIPTAYQDSKNMKGIGITPEAINNSPIVYELIGDMIWTRDSIDFRQWTKNYIERRYGKYNEDIEKAWDILLETAYKKTNNYYQGASESVINSRPATSIDSASTWGHSDIQYNKEELEKAMELFINSYDELKDSQAFIYDFLDVTKQVLANSAQEYHKEMVAVYNSKEKEKFNTISTYFLNLVKLQEEVLSTSPEFLVGTWINQARTMLNGADDWTKDLFEFNARALITTWGDYKNPDLKDYSNRQWAGLTGDLYYKRWEVWINDLKNQLEIGAPASSINWYKMEYEWVNKKTTEGHKYSTEGSGKDLSLLAKEAMDKYSVTKMSEILQGDTNVIDKVNIALGKKIQVSGVETDANFPVSNLTDGTTGTAWKALEAKWPITLTLDLEGEKNINGISFAPNQAAGGFPITYTVEVLSGGTWREVAKTTAGNITGTVALDYKGLGEKVRFTFNSSNKALVPEITEIIVYENEGEKVNYENVALNKMVTGSESEPGRPLSNITDGNDSTLWVANGGEYPSYANVDLGKGYYVDNIELSFEKTGLPFQFYVDVIDSDGNTTRVLDKLNNDTVLEQKYLIPVNKYIKDIKVEIVGNNGQGNAYLAWPAISEVKALSKEKPEIKAENVALKKSVTGSGAEAGKPLSNITDGNDSTLWVADGGEYPSYANVDLGKAYYVDNIELSFEKTGLPFQFYVDVIDSDGNTTRVLDKLNNDTVLEQKYLIPVNKYIKDIKVEIVGNNGQGNAYLAWPAIAEIKAYSKPENIAKGATIISDKENIENLIDEDPNTSLSLLKDDKKEFIINFGRIVDLNAIETLGQSRGGLKYTIKYRNINNQDEWIYLIDKTNNTDTSSINLDMLKDLVTTNAIKIQYYNEEVTINDIKVYKADATTPLSTYISQVEGIYNSSIVGEYSGQYPQVAKDELLNALNFARKEAIKGISSVEVNKEVEKLKQSLKDFYSKAIRINRKALLTKISDANIVLESLKKSSESNFNYIIVKLGDEIAEAMNVYEYKNITQKQIDEATLKLKKSIEESIEVLDTNSQYKVQLDLAKDKITKAITGEGDGQYLQSDIDSFKLLVSKAEEDYKEAKSVEEVKAISETLKVAISDFESKVIVVNNEALVKAIKEAEEIAKNIEGKYYASAIESFITEINKAKIILGDKNSSQFVVDEGLKFLLEAQTQLLKSIVPDKTELKNLVNDANALVKKLEAYNTLKEQKEVLEKLIENSNVIIENEYSTAEEILEIINALKNIIGKVNDSINEFELVSKSELQNIINKAETLNKNDYTNDSYDILKEAIKESKELLNNKEVIQVEVDAATARINNAIKNLVKIEDKNDENNNGSNNGNNSENNGNGENSNNEGKGNDLPKTGGIVPIVTLILGGAASAVGGLLLKKKKED